MPRLFLAALLSLAFLPAPAAQAASPTVAYTPRIVNGPGTSPGVLRQTGSTATSTAWEYTVTCTEPSSKHAVGYMRLYWTRDATLGDIRLNRLMIYSSQYYYINESNEYARGVNVPIAYFTGPFYNTKWTTAIAWYPLDIGGYTQIYAQMDYGLASYWPGTTCRTQTSIYY